MKPVTSLVIPRYVSDTFHVKKLIPRYVSDTFHMKKFIPSYVSDTFHIKKVILRYDSDTFHMKKLISILPQQKDFKGTNIALHKVLLSVKVLTCKQCTEKYV